MSLIFCGGFSSNSSKYVKGYLKICWYILSSKTRNIFPDHFRILQSLIKMALKKDSTQLESAKDLKRPKQIFSIQRWKWKEIRMINANFMQEFITYYR